MAVKSGINQQNQICLLKSFLTSKKFSVHFSWNSLYHEIVEIGIDESSYLPNQNQDIKLHVDWSTNTNEEEILHIY